MSKTLSPAKKKKNEVTASPVTSSGHKKLTGNASKEMFEMLERMNQLKDAFKEYESLDEKVRERLKTLGPGDYRAGDWYLTVEEKTRKTYNIPQDVKEQYVAEGTSTFIKWEKR